METTSSFYDPEDLSIREQFRRYGKRHGTSAVSPHQESSISKFSEPILFHDGTRIHSPTNTALILENIKQEVESIDFEGTPSKMQSAFKRRSSIDSRGLFEADVAVDSVGRLGSQSLKACKIEDESLIESGETTFVDFASLLDSALQGLISIPDLILRFERSCRDVSESIRYGNNIKLWFMEDKLMRQKAQLLLDEAATWSLLWYLYGKGMEDPPEETNLLIFSGEGVSCRYVSSKSRSMAPYTAASQQRWLRCKNRSPLGFRCSDT